MLNSLLKSSLLLLISASSYAQYSNPQLNELSGLLQKEGLNPQWYSTLDAKTAVDKIAKDLYLGRVTPDKMKPKVRIDVKAFPHAAVVQKYVTGQIRADEFVNAVKAKNSVYQKSVRLLNDLQTRKQTGNWTTKPAQLTLDKVELNSKNAKLVKYLRSKLNDLGYRNDITSVVFDNELKSIVMLFQKDHNLAADGVVGKISWSFLDRSLEQLISQAQLNVDRSRWLPDDLGPTHIFVNLTQQRLQLVQNQVKTMDFITINGRVDRQTPLLVDQLRNVILNPTWTVPFSIFMKDKLPELRKDPGYIAKNHMKVIDDLTGKEVDPYSIDWTKNANDLDQYTIVQSPGPWNALGFVKFTLGNPYAIYLHDTSDRGLFVKDLRLLSSGCVRVPYPFELAEKLLDNPQWNIEAIKQFTEFSPTIAEKDTWLKPKIRMPVYLFYLTVFADDDGRIISLNDHYSIDQLQYSLFSK